MSKSPNPRDAWRVNFTITAGRRRFWESFVSWRSSVPYYAEMPITKIIGRALWEYVKNRGGDLPAPDPDAQADYDRIIEEG